MLRCLRILHRYITRHYINDRKYLRFKTNSQLRFRARSFNILHSNIFHKAHLQNKLYIFLSAVRFIPIRE